MSATTESNLTHKGVQNIAGKFLTFSLAAAEAPVALPVEQTAHYQQLLQNKASVLLLRNRNHH